MADSTRLAIRRADAHYWCGDAWCDGLRHDYDCAGDLPLRIGGAILMTTDAGYVYLDDADMTMVAEVVEVCHAAD